MDNKLNYYIQKCRCCFKSLKSARKSIEITRETEERFLKIVGIPLKKSFDLSSIICEVCRNDINEITAKCEKFAENQKFLYQLAADNEPGSSQNELLDFDIDENKLEINLKEEIEEVTLESFDIVESRLDEVVVKVEQVDDEDCVYELCTEPFEYCEDNNSTAHENNSKVVCRKCGEILDSKQAYKSHLNDHNTAKMKGLEDYDENVQKPCKICQIMLLPESRYKHMRNHQAELNNKIFYCDLCKYKSKEKGNIRVHMRIHMSLESRLTYKCKFCPKMFMRLDAQRYHEGKEHSDNVPKKILFCECGKTFNSYSSLYEHRIVKHKSLQFPCKICGKIYRSKSKLQIHFRSVHEKKFACEICGILTSSITSHMKTTHNPVICDIDGCGKLLKSRKGFETHKKITHGIKQSRNRIPTSMKGSETKKVICRKCGTLLDNKEDYVKHLNEHQRLRSQGIDEYDEIVPKPCPFCGKMLLPESRYSHFSSHENEINNIVLRCDHCNFNTTNKNNLINHIKTHMSLVSRLQYKCDICSMEFYSLTNKKYHFEKYHSVQKKVYPCPKCDVVTSSYPSLYRHRQSFHEKNTFKCKHCDEVFPRREKLILHVNKVHKPKVTCEICGISTTQINLHIRNKHTSWKCEFEGCGKMFNSAATFRSHRLAKHSENQLVKCEFCDKEYQNEYYLTRHVDRVHRRKKNKICQVPGCNYASDRRDYLRMHYNNHKNIDEREKGRLIKELYAEK